MIVEAREPLTALIQVTTQQTVCNPAPQYEFIDRPPNYSAILKRLEDIAMQIGFKIHGSMSRSREFLRSAQDTDIEPHSMLSRILILAHLGESLSQTSYRYIDGGKSLPKWSLRALRHQVLDGQEMENIYGLTIFIIQAQESKTRMRRIPWLSQGSFRMTLESREMGRCYECITALGCRCLYLSFLRHDGKHAGCAYGTMAAMEQLTKTTRTLGLMPEKLYGARIPECDLDEIRIEHKAAPTSVRTATSTFGGL